MREDLTRFMRNWRLLVLALGAALAVCGGRRGAAGNDGDWKITGESHQRSHSAPSAFTAR